MAWSHLQSASNTSTEGGTGGTVAATFGTSLSSGSKIIVAICVSITISGTDAVAGISDGTHALTELANSSGANETWLEVWYEDTPAGLVGTKPTITASLTSAAASFGAVILIQEVSGLLTGSSGLDGTPAVATGSNTGPATTGSYSSGAVNEYLFAVGGDPGNDVTWTDDTAGGYSADLNEVNDSNFATLIFNYKNSGHTSESASFIQSASNTWTTLLGAFRIASPPASGPVFHPAVQAIRAKALQNRPRGVYMGMAPKGTSSGTGQIQWNAGGPVKNPTSGPVFHQATSPCRARIPREAPSGSITGKGAGGSICGAINGNAFGQGSGSKGAPVNNPNPGPVFFQRRTPVRFVLSPPPPRKGRVGSSFGAPVQNPIHGPPAYPLQGPARARLPQLQPRAGRAYSNAGAPVRNPAPGPVFTQKTSPVQARHPLPLRGRVYSSATQRIIPPSSGPVFIQANQALRARLPQQPLLRGRVSFNAGAPVRNPAPGPVFQPAVQALRARLSLQPLLRGRSASNAGAPVKNPAPGPVFTQATSPARARILQVFSKGRIGSSPGAPVSNPVSGPPLSPLGQPAGVRVIFLVTGRSQSTRLTAGAPPPLSGPVFYPAHSPARSRITPPPRGRISGNKGAPVRNPVPGPVFRQAASPVRARIPSPPSGRIYVSPVAPAVTVTVIPVAYRKNSAPPRQPLPRRGICRAIRFYPPAANPAPGPVFTPKPYPVRAASPLPPRGRISGNPGTPYIPRTPGPRFHPADSPVRARVPQDGPRGRVYSGKGAPVHNPVPGPVFRQATTPSRARITLPPRGRIAADPGTLPPAVSAYGLFNIVIPYGVPFGGAAFPLPAPKVAISGEIAPGEIGPLSVPLPKPHTALSGDVLHQPLALTLPLPVTSLSGVVQYGLLSVVLPSPHVTLNTGILDHAGDFAIVFNVMPMGFGLLVTRPEKAPRLRAGDDYGSADFTTGTPFAGWSTGTPQTGWSTGNPS